MARAQQQRPFIESFTSWFSPAVDLHEIVAYKPCKDRDAVEINFLTGGGALHGYAHKGGISVAAMHDDDLVAGCELEGWHCSMCAVEIRLYFPSVTELWCQAPL